MTEYRVDLDVYNGPLDLLLYLIRREEVDIHDIPIARIAEQYVQYVDLLKVLDPDLAGEFLVMAATLMEIKTRTLLPSPPPEEGGADELQIDPRAELVRQLLAYKAFKDAASDLTEAAATQAMKFPRAPIRRPEKELEELDLEDVQVWHLLDAFSKLMESIGQNITQQEVIYDDTPVETHAENILERLGRCQRMLFHEVFAGSTGRSEIVGLFLALLELVRRDHILVAQDRNFGEIHVGLNPNPRAERNTAAGPPDEADQAPHT